jgi:hypothetical protein
VRIKYTPLEGEGDKKFESEVSSHKRSAGPDSKASTGKSLSKDQILIEDDADAVVAGTETLTPK